MAIAAPWEKWLPLKVVSYMNSAGTSVDKPAPVPGHRLGQVEDLERDMAQDDHGAEGDRLEQGQDHPAEDLPLGRAVHARRLAQLFGDAAQAGQVHGHDVARHLPDRGDDHGFDAEYSGSVNQPARSSGSETGQSEQSRASGLRPSAGVSSQRQATPVTMKDTARGNMKMLRKMASPLMC